MHFLHVVSALLHVLVINGTFDGRVDLLKLLSFVGDRWRIFARHADIV